ncbi:hypothetical protein HPULCUR_001766 [Helicostylum pulchrum]|uniref:Uncharacterized protein n=1 Tax=Helicostylum pulchrum TaxID=562976 RepID=A0ABP9XNL2_9FUNG
MDLEIPNSFDPALKHFLRSLQNDMKTFAGLVTTNENLTAENESLRAQVQKLQLLCENRKNDNISRTRSPNNTLTPVSNTKEKLLGSAASKHAPVNVTPPVAEWTQVVQRKANNRKQKAPLSDRKRLAMTRPFSSAPENKESPSGYEYVYIYRKRAMTRKDIRYRFNILGVTNARVIDLNFPASAVIGILIHKEFKPAFKAILNECKIPTLDEFDPTAGANVADPKYANLEPQTRDKYSASLHHDRCIRTLEFIREYLVPNVARFFVEQKWIDQQVADEIVSRRIPRPIKKRNTVTNTSAANDFINNYFAHQPEPTTTPTGTTIANSIITNTNKFSHYGGGEIDHMDTTEEFAENAYGTDSDEELKEDSSSDEPKIQ